MPGLTDIVELAALVQTATVEAASVAYGEDDEAASSAVRWQIDAINRLASHQASTPAELAVKSQACIAVLASDVVLADAMVCTRNLVQSVLEDATRFLPEVP